MFSQTSRNGGTDAIANCLARDVTRKETMGLSGCFPAGTILDRGANLAFVKETF